MEEYFATEEEARRAWEILETTGALKRGHFLLRRTGLHYEHFFQVPLALQYSRYAKILCVALGRVLRRSGVLYRLDSRRRFTMVAPMDAGIPVAFWTGEHLDADRVLWVNREDGAWSFRPFIDVDEDDQVILVDDAILTGGTVDSVASFLRKRGASIVAVATLVDRREERTPVAGSHGYCVIHEKGKKWEPGHCPLCDDDVELVKIPS